MKLFKVFNFLDFIYISTKISYLVIGSECERNWISFEMVIQVHEVI